MVKLCVFDAYGTLFDVDAAAREAGLPDALWPMLSANWRRKQLEYSWLRSLAGRHADFWQITQDALDWALEAAGQDDPALRARLLALYEALPPYAEVPSCLAALRAQGTRLAILSNGTPQMLDAALRSATLADSFEAVLSVESVGIFKPARPVYDMVGAAFSVTPRDVLFISSNGWDITAGAAYGFRTLWVNRAGAPRDRLPDAPDAEVPDLAGLPAYLERL